MGVSSNMIPELINSYQVFDDTVKTHRLLGVSGEIELPSFESITDTIDVAGGLGEFEAPATGQYAGNKIKIPFAILHDDIFQLADTTKPVAFTLRGSEQFNNPKTYNTDYYPVKIVIRGKTTTLNLGKLIKGKKGDPEVETEIYYIKVVMDGVTELELDKLNFKFILHGKDMLEKIRDQVGLTS